MALRKSEPVYTAPVRYRISVDQYDRMVASGAFDEDARLELINGEIVEMTPIGPPHTSRVNRLNMLFARKAGDRAIVQIQGPVRVGEYSEPQPDVLLLKPRADFYGKRHPCAEDVLLLIEVAQSSLSVDRNVKGPLYRGEEILEYWIVNLIDEVIEVYRRPDPRVRSLFRRGETLAPVAFPDLVVAVEDILGPVDEESGVMP